jgi:predicted transcriptional regulator
MKLKILNVVITTHEQFVSSMKKSLSTKVLSQQSHTIEFDSFDTFKRVINLNKIQILMAIARLKPVSINQLSKLLDREFPHVLKDCYSLETYGFIKLEETGGARRQLTPKLIFDYDLIRVKTNIEEILPISERSNHILLTS